MKWDLFVSHATEDKKEFVEPLVNLLISMGLKVWYDSYVLEIGDSLRKSIEKGIRESKYGVIVLSKSFFKKKWTQIELNTLFSKQDNEQNSILPIWHKVTSKEIFENSPFLADYVALNSDKGIDYVAERIFRKVASNNVDAGKSESETIFKNQIKLRIAWDGGKCHSIIEGALDYYHVYRPKYKFIKEKISDSHEWGSGGEKKYGYSIENDKKQILFLIEVTESYDTTSDDSTDYAYPTEIIIYSNMDFNETPLKEIVDKLNSNQA